MRGTLRQTRMAGLLLLAAAVVLLTAGCEKSFTDYDAFVKTPRPLVSSAEYRLAPPDTILIASKVVREINGHTETIRPDGKITLPLLGSVFVAGLTVEQVSANLQAMAQEYYQEADVSVRIIGYNSKKFFVFGEVAAPGAYRYDGANTILGTLAVAQPTRLADPAKIHILRPSKEGDVRRRMTIDMDKMVKEGDTSLDAILEEGDIVYVPANPLAKVGLALQQALLPLQPAAQTVAAPADIGSDLDRKPYDNTGGSGGSLP